MYNVLCVAFSFPGPLVTLVENHWVGDSQPLTCTAPVVCSGHGRFFGAFPGLLVAGFDAREKPNVCCPRASPAGRAQWRQHAAGLGDVRRSEGRSDFSPGRARGHGHPLFCIMGDTQSAAQDDARPLRATTRRGGTRGVAGLRVSPENLTGDGGFVALTVKALVSLHQVI